MKQQPSNESRLAAKDFTSRQNNLRMMDFRQRQVESYLGDVPVRMRAVGSAPSSKNRALSEPSLGSSATIEASRDHLEKLGFLVGRSKGRIADGLSGAHGTTRRHNPLSMHATLHSRSTSDGNQAGRSLSHSTLPSRSKKWQMSTVSAGFVFDPRNSLPPPKGGWSSQTPTSWPDIPCVGRREFEAPHPCDPTTLRKPPNMEALPEWPRSPTAHERSVAAGSATATLRKLQYGEVREPGQERQGLGPMALEATAKLGKAGGSPAPVAT